MATSQEGLHSMELISYIIVCKGKGKAISVQAVEALRVVRG
jgi:hypothetical protein